VIRISIFSDSGRKSKSFQVIKNNHIEKDGKNSGFAEYLAVSKVVSPRHCEGAARSNPGTGDNPDCF
jgi:hypothetical protein